MQWPHNIGPLMTYMAECTGTTCDKFDASQAKWFKIDEVGKDPGNDTWVQENIREYKLNAFTVLRSSSPACRRRAGI